MTLSGILPLDMPMCFSLHWCFIAYVLPDADAQMQTLHWKYDSVVLCSVPEAWSSV